VKCAYRHGAPHGTCSSTFRQTPILIKLTYYAGADLELNCHSVPQSLTTGKPNQ